MNLAAPVGKSVEFEAFCLQSPEQVAHAVYLLGHEFRIVFDEESYLFLKLTVLAYPLFHYYVERLFLTV